MNLFENFPDYWMWKFINGRIYWHWTGRMSNCLSKLLQEVLGCALAIILMILFSKVKKKNLPTVGRVTPKNYSIFYSKMRACIVNWLIPTNFPASQPPLTHSLYTHPCYIFNWTAAPLNLELMHSPNTSQWTTNQHYATSQKGVGLCCWIILCFISSPSVFYIF